MLSQCLPTSIGSIWLTIREQMRFEDFQDGYFWDHLRYRTRAILAILRFCVTPMPPNVWAQRVLFYSNNLDLLPPKPKLSFRYLKQGIQEFHRKYVLAPADKAANNVVVVWRLYYINTLIQELGGTKTCERIPTDERSIVNTHSIDIIAKFAVSIKEKQDRLPTLYWLRNFINDLIKHVSLLILVHVRLLFYPNC